MVRNEIQDLSDGRILAVGKLSHAVLFGKARQLDAGMTHTDTIRS